MSDDSPSEGTSMQRAVEKKAFALFYRILIYGIGTLTLAGAGSSAYAHARISDDHDQTSLNKNDINTLQKQLDNEINERKSHDLRTEEKLDRIIEMLYDRNIRVEASEHVQH